jgi:hypothetical protein
LIQKGKDHKKTGQFWFQEWVTVMVFNAIFNNISVISWWSILLVEEAGVSGENHRPAKIQCQICQSCISDVKSTIMCLFQSCGKFKVKFPNHQLHCIYCIAIPLVQSQWISILCSLWNLRPSSWCVAAGKAMIKLTELPIIQYIQCNWWFGNFTLNLPHDWNKHIIVDLTSLMQLWQIWHWILAGGKFIP